MLSAMMSRDGRLWLQAIKQAACEYLYAVCYDVTGCNTVIVQQNLQGVAVSVSTLSAVVP